MKSSELSSSLAHDQCTCPGSHHCQPWLLGTQSISHHPWKQEVESGRLSSSSSRPMESRQQQPRFCAGRSVVCPRQDQESLGGCIQLEAECSCRAEATPACDLQQCQQRLCSCVQAQSPRNRARPVPGCVYSQPDMFLLV